MWVAAAIAASGGAAAAAAVSSSGSRGAPAIASVKQARWPGPGGKAALQAFAGDGR
jgi:hypothetical protein